MSSHYAINLTIDMLLQSLKVLRVRGMPVCQEHILTINETFSIRCDFNMYSLCRPNSCILSSAPICKALLTKTHWNGNTVSPFPAIHVRLWYFIIAKKYKYQEIDRLCSFLHEKLNSIPWKRRKNENNDSNCHENLWRFSLNLTKDKLCKGSSSTVQLLKKWNGLNGLT